MRWTLDNKVVQVTKGNRYIRYWYDASGNRVMKRLHGDTVDYILRDASGNELQRLVRRQNSGASPILMSREASLYGSSRLGTYQFSPNPGNDSTEKRSNGKTTYELTDHLGNVRATVSDQKTYTAFSGGYTLAANVLSASDLYPYGMAINTRSFAAGTYRYGFNGKENERDLLDYQDYGQRVYTVKLGRFLTVDPLTAKFPMLSPYQFGSLNPVSNIDLDGLEGVPSISYEIFKGAGITTVTSSFVESKVKEGIVKAGRLSQDALIVASGILTVVGSGGAALPVALGVVAAGGGSLKFYYDSKGEYDNSESTPTTISGVVMVTANYMVGGELFSQSFQATVSFVEGAATLDLKNLTNPNFLKRTNEVISLVNLSVDAGSIPDNLKDLFSPNTNFLNPQDLSPNIAPADNTSVAPPIIIPVKKNEAKAEDSTEPSSSQ